jgi:hypothetical protein
MTEINVQFADATANAAIISVFAGPQDGSIYANLGTVNSNDPRYATFIAQFPAFMARGLPAVGS